MSDIIINKSVVKETVVPALVAQGKSSINSAVSLVKYLGLGKVQIVNAKNNPYDGKLDSTYQKDDVLGQSSLGTPIYTDLTLIGVDSYTDNLTGQQITSLKNDRYRSGAVSAPPAGVGAAFYMNLETVIMVVNQPIRVIKTEIQGRNGTVKEYIGADDAKITINCIITGKNGAYPRSEVNRLKAWLDAPIAKGVVAWWLGNLGINSVVVENYSMPQVQGGYSYQIVSIDCISDTPVELKITQPAQ